MDKIQIVVLAAGNGIRLLPLTNDIPKVLVDINGKSTLERCLDSISDIASEIIIVINYHGNKIKEKIRSSYKGVSVKYADIEPKGTGHAISEIKGILDKRFMVIYGDDILCKSDLEKSMQNEFAIIGAHVINPSKFGILDYDDNDYLSDIVEKPANPPGNLANAGGFTLNKKIFEHKLKPSIRGEYEIIDYIKYLIKAGEKIKVIKTDYWYPIGNFEELDKARSEIK